VLALILAPEIRRNADEVMPLEMMENYARWLMAGAGLWLLGTVIALIQAWRQRLDAAFVAYALGSFVFLNAATLGHESFARANSAYSIAQEVKPLLTPDVPFYSVDFYEQTLPFYIQRTVTLVAYRDEMDFGLKQQPTLSLKDKEDFYARWFQDKDAFAIMAPATYADLRALNLPMQEIARDTRRVIVRKPQ
jgi:hypothetical protein